jgi:hypothetical protein
MGKEKLLSKWLMGFVFAGDSRILRERARTSTLLAVFKRRVLQTLQPPQNGRV